MWLISILLIAMSLVLPEVRAEHPNVLLFLMDDIGADRFRFYGSNINYSPNLNEFAKTATRFDAFFTHPLCGPSRAALLSGRFSSNTGALNNGHRRNTYFDPSECTLGATFQHAGYDTAIFGKVHAAHRFFFQRGKWPAFDEVCGFNHWALWARSSPRYANSTVSLFIYLFGTRLKDVENLHVEFNCTFMIIANVSFMAFPSKLSYSIRNDSWYLCLLELF